MSPKYTKSFQISTSGEFLTVEGSGGGSPVIMGVGRYGRRETGYPMRRESGEIGKGFATLRNNLQ